MQKSASKAYLCKSMSAWFREECSIQCGLIQASQWSETGDYYLLKLFRDFVFHQCNEDGAPVIDWGHIVECLNKVRVALV